jgi:hypothetical protein
MPFVITQGELEYEAGLVLTGKAYKVFLATTGSLTLTSTLTAWEAAELATSAGYAAVTGTVGTGSYNGTTGRFEAPVITGQFGPATGAGFTFDAMVIKLASRTKPYAVNLYASPITLAAGQSRAFSITLGVKP